MTSGRDKLIELAEQVLGCAERALLDARLDALASGDVDDDVRDVLLGVHEAGEADTLRQLLSGERLARWLDRTATQREEHVLRDQLRRWLGQGGAGADDPARLVEVAALPTELEPLLAWARRYDLLGELTRPADEVLPEGLSVPDLSLAECALGARPRGVRGASLLGAAEPAEAARRWLLRQAAEHGAPEARAALWKTKPAPGPLRAVSERLLALVAGSELRALHAVRFVPAQPVVVDGSSGACRGRIVAGDEVRPLVVQVFLSGYELRALHAECSGCKRKRCIHVRALAARLVDACADPSDRLHPALVAFASAPSWSHFLDALEPEASAKEPEAERIVFRVRWDEVRPSVGVLRKRRLSDGRYSAGKLVAAPTLLRDASIPSRDRIALEAIAQRARSPGPGFVAADLGVLRALVEHPSVEIEGSEAMLRLREATLHVELHEQPDGLVPRVRLAGELVPAGERPADVGALVRHDRATDTLIFAPLTAPLRRLLAALARFHGVLPPESYPKLAPFLAELRGVAQVDAPTALRGTERLAPRRILVRIAPSFDEGVDVVVCVRPLPLSALWSPGLGPEVVHGLESGAPVYALRALDREREEAARIIHALGLDRHLRLEPFAYRVETHQDALAMLSAAARLGDAVEIEWAERARRFGLGPALRANALTIGVSKKGAWLSFEGSVRRGDVDVAVSRLLDAVKRGERYVRVQGDDYAEIEQELFDRLAAAQLCLGEGPRASSFSLAATPYWLVQLGEGLEAGDDETRAWIARFRERDDADDTPLPAHLRDYQREGVRFLLARSRWAPGACLADEMGLGKTAQAIALLDARAALGPALVVAPTSVVPNWLAEIARFAPSLRAHEHRGKGRLERLRALAPGSVLVVSYDLLLRDRASFDELRFATQIVDEAQLVKNARTMRARAVSGIRADFRVALTGTPIENRLGDLFSLFHLVAPGLLGSWARFRGRFGVPIERYENEERAAALRALVGPFLLRRTKDDVAAELPARTEVVHRVELSPAERDLYDVALRRAKAAIGKRRGDQASQTTQILAELTRLRQLACHPRLVLDDERMESSKLAALLRLLEDVLPRGHRVLLFSQFTRHLALVREALDRVGVTHLQLDGSTPATERAGLVARFQDGEAQVFLISLKAGGTGLNLTAADYVVHLDPWWNPAAEDQASDRAHRIGQERPTTIVKLVARDTIEEKVLELHQHKRRLAGVMLGAGPELGVEALAALL